MIIGPTLNILIYTIVEYLKTKLITVENCKIETNRVSAFVDNFLIS